MKQENFLRRFPFNVVAAFAVQYLLGMYTNILAPLPDGGDIGADWDFAHRSIPLMAHVALGGFIVLGSIFYVVAAIRSKQKWLIWLAALGCAASVTSFVSGERFMATQNGAFSMLMAIGFLVAILTYGVTGYEVRRRLATPGK